MREFFIIPPPVPPLRSFNRAGTKPKKDTARLELPILEKPEFFFKREWEKNKKFYRPSRAHLIGTRLVYVFIFLYKRGACCLLAVFDELDGRFQYLVPACPHP
jgi:hypothetical protein